MNLCLIWRLCVEVFKPSVEVFKPTVQSVEVFKLLVWTVRTLNVQIRLFLKIGTSYLCKFKIDWYCIVHLACWNSLVSVINMYLGHDSVIVQNFAAFKTDKAKGDNISMDTLAIEFDPSLHLLQWRWAILLFLQFFGDIRSIDSRRIRICRGGEILNFFKLEKFPHLLQWRWAILCFSWSSHGILWIDCSLIFIGDITHAGAKGPFPLFQPVPIRSLSDDLHKMRIRTRMICTRCESDHHCCDGLAVSPGDAAAASPGGDSQVHRVPLHLRLGKCLCILWERC